MSEGIWGHSSGDTARHLSIASRAARPLPRSVGVFSITSEGGFAALPLNGA